MQQLPSYRFNSQCISLSGLNKCVQDVTLFYRRKWLNANVGWCLKVANSLSMLFYPEVWIDFHYPLSVQLQSGRAEMITFSSDFLRLLDSQLEHSIMM